MAEGCYKLGLIHQDSTEVAGAMAIVVDLFEQACEGGEMKGCTSLGLLYQDTLGVTQDFARSAVLFDQACDGDDVQGCSLLGILYTTGQGVTQNHTRAAELFQQACDGEDDHDRAEDSLRSRAESPSLAFGRFRLGPEAPRRL